MDLTVNKANINEVESILLGIKLGFPTKEAFLDTPFCTPDLNLHFI